MAIATIVIILTIEFNLGAGYAKERLLPMDDFERDCLIKNGTLFMDERVWVNQDHSYLQDRCQFKK